MKKNFLGLFAVVLFVVLFQSASADVVIRPDTNVDQDVPLYPDVIISPYIAPKDIIIAPMPGYNPVDISWLHFDVEQGDVLYNKFYANLVVLEPGKALRMDFNIPDYEFVSCAEWVSCVLPLYEKTGKADAFISWVLDAEMDDLWKQIIIWKYLGVDESALRIQWLEYGNTKEKYDQLSNSEYMVKARLQDIGVLFEDALNSNQIGIEYYSANGYSSVSLELRAYSDVPVNIPLGQVFENKNGGNQDLGVAEPVLVYMISGKDKTLEIRTYCIEAHKGVPSGVDELAPQGTVEQSVLDVMIGQYAAGNTKSNQGMAQSAIWSETDYDGYTPIEGDNVPDQDVMDWINTEGPLDFSGPETGPDSNPPDTGNNPIDSADASGIIVLLVVAVGLVTIVSAVVGIMLAK